MTYRLIVFISGDGSGLQAIVNAVKDGQLPNVEIVLVVSNRGAAQGLTYAKTAGLPTLYFPLKIFTDTGLGRQSYDAALAEKLQPYKPDLLVQAGWMHVFSHSFLDHFPDKVLNLHPVLPSQFAGVDGIKRTFEAFRSGQATHGGWVVDWVMPEADAGPTIAETLVSISEGDTLQAFDERMRVAEQRLIVRAIKKILTPALPAPEAVPTRLYLPNEASGPVIDG